MRIRKIGTLLIVLFFINSVFAYSGITYTGYNREYYTNNYQPNYYYTNPYSSYYNYTYPTYGSTYTTYPTYYTNTYTYPNYGYIDMTPNYVTYYPSYPTYAYPTYTYPTYNYAIPTYTYPNTYRDFYIYNNNSGWGFGISSGGLCNVYGYC